MFKVCIFLVKYYFFFFLQSYILLLSLMFWVPFSLQKKSGYVPAVSHQSSALSKPECHLFSIVFSLSTVHFVSFEEVSLLLLLLMFSVSCGKRIGQVFIFSRNTIHNSLYLQSC